MPQYRDIGYNINEQGISPERVVDDLRLLRPRTALVMNGAKLAAALASEVEENGVRRAFVPRVISRTKDTDEGGIKNDDHAHTKHDPEAFAWAHFALAARNTLIYLGNEPGSGSLPALNDWTQRAVARLHDLGAPGAVVFNFDVTHPRTKAGWRTVKPAAIDAVQAGGAIGIHIYLNLTVAASEDAFRPLWEAREVLGDMPMVVTEYGIAKDFNPFLGWRDFISQEQYVEETLKGIELHGDPALDWLYFIYGIWNANSSFAYHDAPVIKQGQTAHNNRLDRRFLSLIPRPEDAPLVRAKVLSLPSGVSFRNIRTGAGAAFARAGEIRSNDEIRYAPQSERQDDKGRRWLYVETETERGWTMVEGATIEPLEAEPSERRSLAKLPAEYVNVRNNPNGNIVNGRLRLNDRVRYYPARRRFAGAYEWVFVEPEDGTKPGWVALQNGKVEFVPVTAGRIARLIDVSQWQGDVDWKAVAASGIDAAYVRATMGVAGVDSKFLQNASRAPAHLPVGYYHLLRPERDGEAQARHFLNAIAPFPASLSVAVDVELDGSDVGQRQTPARIADVLLAFVQTVEAALGYKPTLYTAAWFWNPRVDRRHDAVFSQCPLWVAHYGVDTPTLPRGWKDWTIWQYTSGGSVPGILGRVDMNKAAAAARIAENAPQTPAAPENPPSGSAPRFVHPVANPVISQPFGVNWTGVPDFYARHGLPAHEGIDYDGEEGDPVFAIADGIVKLIARDNGVHPYGNHVRIAHQIDGEAYESVYAHLRGFPPGLVAGDVVQAGETVGYMGSTGNARGVHLHLAVKKQGATARGERQRLPDGREVVYPRDVVDPTPFFEG